ncbi:MAG TPA: diguanylate cyclase [Gemmatimonadaceae bacterium]|nr:diguanylate cyclase [Gemmatimonadaceae bacterium]
MLTSKYLPLARTNSIKGRILTFAVLATLVPSGLTMWYAYSQARNSMEEKISGELESASTQAARALGVWLKERLYDLRVFATSNEVSDNLSRLSRSGTTAPPGGRLSEYLRSVHERSPDFDRLSVVDMQGRVVASSTPGTRAVRLPDDWTTALRADGQTVGDVFWDNGSGDGKLFIAVRVQGAGGRLLGAFAADVKLAAVQEVLRSFAVDTTSTLYLINDKGGFLASSRGSSPQLTATQLSPGALAKLTAVASRTVSYQSAGGVEVLASLTAVPQVQWAALSETPAIAAFDKLTRFRNIGVLIVVALLAAVTAGAYRFGLIVTRPLDRLTEGAAEVAAGNLEVDLPGGGTGEVGALTSVFNYMVAKLREGRRALDAANETLRQRNDELAQLSVTDGLTGVANRRYLVQRLSEEAQRAGRSGERFAILMTDVDHFKQYNDTFGHPAGDEVLKKVASILSESIRMTDCVARYGGEEFCVLLTSTKPDEVMPLAERIRAKIASAKFEGSSVTLSIGVAAFPEAGKTPEAVVAAADEALYQAKRDGRNKVVRWKATKKEKA